MAENKTLEMSIRTQVGSLPSFCWKSVETATLDEWNVRHMEVATTDVAAALEDMGGDIVAIKTTGPVRVIFDTAGGQYIDIDGVMVLQRSFANIFFTGIASVDVHVEILTLDLETDYVL